APRASGLQSARNALLWGLSEGLFFAADGAVQDCGAKAMKEHPDWNDCYRDGSLPWDTGRPSSELQSVLSQNAIRPCRALELGCGTGTNCVWLAQQGFEVTGVDVAPLAVEAAEKRAKAAGVKVRFL